MKRESISKKTRFEVFKRDNFTCQYCGSMAPDVLLEIDHIHPVAKGGKANILNLITSCRACNSGKSDRLLGDNSILNKQRQQLSDLSERRAQIEMMLQWREETISTKEREVSVISNYIFKSCGFQIEESDVSKIKKLIREFGFENLIDAIDISVDQYFESDYSSFRLVLKKLGGIANFKSQPDHIKKIIHAINILRNRGFNFNNDEVKPLMISYYNEGYDLDSLINYCRQVEYWKQLINWLLDI